MFMSLCSTMVVVFFFNDTATTEIYTLSLHDALPICRAARRPPRRSRRPAPRAACPGRRGPPRAPGAGRRSSTDPSAPRRSEEHTSELQSRQYLVCRLLLEKKKKRLTPDRTSRTCILP